MAVPVGYTAFKEASKRLAERGFDCGEDWASAVWDMFHDLPVKGLAPNGSRLDLECDELIDPVQADFPRGIFSLGDNMKVDVFNGTFISGQFAGCILMVRTVDLNKYLTVPSKGGRPSNVEKIAERYRLTFPNGHTGKTWEEAASACATSATTLKRALGKKK